jgi:hypothetical protein
MEFMLIIVREVCDLLKFDLERLKRAKLDSFMHTFGRRMAALEPANRLTGWISKVREFMTTAIALARPFFIYVESMLSPPISNHSTLILRWTSPFSAAPKVKWC